MKREAVLAIALGLVGCGGDDASGEATGAGSAGAASSTSGTSSADTTGAAEPTSSGAVDGSTGADASSSSSSGGAAAGCWDDLAVGEVEVVYDGFSEGSEGISFGADGQLIATTIEDGEGTLWALADGEATAFAQVPYALGLAPRSGGGFVVASIGELMQPDGGVYEVSADGETTLLVDGIDSPNFITLAPDGSTLVSDDFDTRVFHVTADGTVSTVIENVPSPNGMAYSPDASAFYVATTFDSAGQLTRYDVGEDGLPIEATGVEIMHAGPGQFPDGIAVDADGFVYVLANLSGSIWRVDGAATDLQPGEVVVEGLDSPASMAFGRGDGFDPCSAYITELRGTRVVRVALGVAGAPLQG
ncbi:MAG: SMP-30/gluconolactonase/LRE family protein [Myxococcota bacterium]